MLLGASWSLDLRAGGLPAGEDFQPVLERYEALAPGRLARLTYRAFFRGGQIVSEHWWLATDSAEGFVRFHFRNRLRLRAWYGSAPRYVTGQVALRRTENGGEAEGTLPGGLRWGFRRRVVERLGWWEEGSPASFQQKSREAFLGWRMKDLGLMVRARRARLYAYPTDQRTHTLELRSTGLWGRVRWAAEYRLLRLREQRLEAFTSESWAGGWLVIPWSTNWESGLEWRRAVRRVSTTDWMRLQENTLRAHLRGALGAVRVASWYLRARSNERQPVDRRVREEAGLRVRFRGKGWTIRARYARKRQEIRLRELPENPNLMDVPQLVRSWRVSAELWVPQPWYATLWLSGQEADFRRQLGIQVRKRRALGVELGYHWAAGVLALQWTEDAYLGRYPFAEAWHQGTETFQERAVQWSYRRGPLSWSLRPGVADYRSRQPLESRRVRDVFLDAEIRQRLGPRRAMGLRARWSRFRGISEIRKAAWVEAFLESEF